MGELPCLARSPLVLCCARRSASNLCVPASAASTGNGSPMAAATYGFESRKYGLAVGAWMAGSSQRGRGLCLGTTGATIHWRAGRWLPQMTRAAGGKGQALWLVPLSSLGEAEPCLTVPAGHLQECQRDPCCTIGCKLRRGVQCLSGPCCRKCKVSRVVGAGRLHSLGIESPCAGIIHVRA